MEWCVLRPKKNPTSSAAALPHTQKCNLVFCFSHCWMFVAGSTEGVCSFRQWGNVGLPLCILCLNPFFSDKYSYPFLLSPHFFCMRPFCIDPFRPCFSLPCWFMYLQGHYAPYLHPATHLIGKTGWQWCSVSSDPGDLFPFLLTALAS